MKITKNWSGEGNIYSNELHYFALFFVLIFLEFPQRNWVLTFPIILRSIDLIEAHLFFILCFTLCSIFPQTFIEYALCARPGERLEWCIDQTSPCSGGTSCLNGWTDGEIICNILKLSKASFRHMFT